MRMQNSVGKVFGVVVLGAAFAALGTGVSQAEPAVPVVGGMLGQVPVAQGALANSPLNPAANTQQASSTGGQSRTVSQDQSKGSAVIAGIPLQGALPFGG